MSEATKQAYAISDAEYQAFRIEQKAKLAYEEDVAALRRAASIENRHRKNIGFPFPSAESKWGSFDSVLHQLELMPAHKPSLKSSFGDIPLMSSHTPSYKYTKGSAVDVTRCHWNDLEGAPTLSFHGDFFVFGEGDLFGIFGGNVGTGIVLDLDSPLESGVFFSLGGGTGGSYGAAVGAGYVSREIEGVSGELDINAIAASYTAIADEKGPMGGAVTFGPGKGASTSLTKTWTYSVKDAYEDVKGIFSGSKWDDRSIFPNGYIGP